MPFKASPLQENYFTWIKTGVGSAVVEAVAGSGKTTTLVMGLTFMEGSKFFGAYNKKIAVEIESKTNSLGISQLTVSTMHAAGFKAWRNFANNVKVDDKKCRGIFRDACSRNPQYGPFEDAVLSLVSLAKQSAFGVAAAATRADWEQLITHYSIDCLEDDELCIKLAFKVLQASISIDHQVIDFDDMIYAPLIHKSRIAKYDWVLVDEAQDTNAARRLLALAMMKSTSRMVAVGDEHQAIYGFTGADADALRLITAATSATKLPLTVSYRCPQAVVAYARRFVTHIEAHPEAPQGEVAELNVSQLATTAVVGDAILCRFNAPIVKQAYAFVAKGIPAKVEGREIGEGLKKLATRWKAKTFDALLKRLDEYEEREIAKAQAKEQNARVSSIEDSVTCLRIIIDRVLKVGSAGTPSTLVCAEIDSIFGDDISKGPHVLLSTIHKSKGREWHNVFWLQTGPSKFARLAWELEQENNLCYVAVTRAQTKLILVNMEEAAK